MTAEYICKKALEINGAEAQTCVVFEEMAELQKELCKHARGKENVKAIAEEIADVRIMLEQLTLLYDCETEVEVWRMTKLSRLAERLGLVPAEA